MVSLNLNPVSSAQGRHQVNLLQRLRSHVVRRGDGYSLELIDMFVKRFKDRLHAGELLAKQLTDYANRPGVIVLALPRGGVPVGYAVAKALHAALDVFVVRKLGIPGHEEYAMGAIASGGEVVLNDGVVQRFRIPMEAIEATAQRELQELERREKLYRAGRPPLQLRRCTVILVDDGLATGATMSVALRAVREQNPARVIVAVPVGAPEVCRDMRERADEVVCYCTPDPFYAVGLWYEDFSQTTDEEVQKLLEEARQWQSSQTGCASQTATSG
jgi:predicted phosphoribosyltransferase